MTPLPPYPGPTKELSVNYGAGGQPFAIGNEGEDDLDERDLYRLARAVEDHNHGEGRGLAVNRIGTTTAPQTAGDLQVQGDDLRWWADLADAIYSAVNAQADQTVNGTKRFNQPLLLPAQATPPAAPGLGLGYVYLGPGDRLYLRAGNGSPTPVGTPALMAAALAWQTTQAAGQTQLQQLAQLTAPTWVQSFRPASDDVMSLTTVGPFTYGGTPVTVHLTWTCGPGAGKVNFTLLARVVPVGGSLLGAWTAVEAATVDAPNADLTHQRTTLVWDTALPAAGDVVFLGVQRVDATEAAAGTKFAGAVSCLSAAVVYG
jgi:hypothetical protein